MRGNGNFKNGFYTGAAKVERAMMRAFIRQVRAGLCDPELLDALIAREVTVR